MTGEVDWAAAAAEAEVEELVAGPATLEHLMARGVALARAGAAEAARRSFKAAVLRAPGDVEANFNMGLFYEITHQPDEMVRWIERVLALQPEHYMALVLLGKYQERIGNSGGALQTYRKALECEEDPRLARGQIEQLLADHRVSLEALPAWPAGAAEAILAEDPRWTAAFPAWQENFLHPVADPARSLLLSADGVCAWDDAVAEPLLSWLEASVDDLWQFVSTNCWLAPGGGSVTTAWLPREKTWPEMAAEAAIQMLIPRLLGEEVEDFCGVEWWARLRVETRGQALHYDQSEADEPGAPCERCGAEEQGAEWLHGNPWRPRWSSVLYLSDEGGPTVLLEQVHTTAGRNEPRCPQRGFVVMPRRGRWLVFRGDLFHGSAPADSQGARPRKVLVFNMWRAHRPPPRHCDVITFDRHPALRKHLLTPEKVQEAFAAEAERLRRGRGPVAVRRERLATTAALPCRSTFGCLPCPLPVPSPESLRAGTGLFELDWRAAAAEATAGKAAAGGFGGCGAAAPVDRPKAGQAVAPWTPPIAYEAVD